MGGLLELVDRNARSYQWHRRRILRAEWRDAGRVLYDSVWPVVDPHVVDASFKRPDLDEAVGQSPATAHWT